MGSTRSDQQRHLPPRPQAHALSLHTHVPSAPTRSLPAQLRILAPRTFSFLRSSACRASRQLHIAASARPSAPVTVHATKRSLMFSA